MSDDFKRKRGGYRGPARRTGRQYSKHGQCPCCTTGGSKRDQNQLARTRLAVDTREAALDGEQTFRDDRNEEAANWCRDPLCCGLCGNCAHCSASSGTCEQESVEWPSYSLAARLYADLHLFHFRKSPELSGKEEDDICVVLDILLANMSDAENANPPLHVNAYGHTDGT